MTDKILNKSQAIAVRDAMCALITATPGQTITLRPSEGCYQQEKTAVVTRVTDLYIFAIREGDGQHESCFYRDNGGPRGARGREFPRYVIKIA